MRRKNICALSVLLAATQLFGFAPVNYYSPSLCQPVQYSTSLKVGCCIGAGVVLGIGLYKLCGWLIRYDRLQTDRLLIDLARRDSRLIRQKHDVLSNILELESHVPRNSTQVVGDRILPMLSPLVCPTNQANSCHAVIEDYGNSLNRDIATLDQHNNRLGERLAKSQIRAELEISRNDLQTTVGRLRGTHGFFEIIKPLVIMQTLQLRHGEEIAAVQGRGNNQEATRIAVMRYQLLHHDAQPYLRYRDDVLPTLDAIQSSRGRLSVAAQQAYDALRTVINCILGSNELREDQAGRQRAIQRQQELELQQRQVEAQAEQARAASMEAAASSRLARAKTEEAYERRRARQKSGQSDVLDFVHDVFNPL